MAFSVSRRVREMGIRMAIGASAGDVIRLCMRQGARQLLLGIAIGFVLGGALVRVARAVLFEVQPSDPTVFVLVAGVLAGAAFVACLIPALRATRVDPVIALRAE
jgi:ABC-type antimicrobial peptide transport system permease subunit